MFPFPCFKCSRLCRLDEGLECSICKNNSNTGAGMYESFHPERPEMAVPRETGVASGPIIHLDPNLMPLNSAVLVQNGKRNEPNDQIIKKIIQPNTQSRQENCKITVRNSDFMQETNASTNRITYGYNHSDNMCKPLLKNEPQWNIGIFQGTQKDNAPINKEFFNNESQWNIAQFQGAQKNNTPVNEALLNNEYPWNISQYQGSQKDNSPVNKAFMNNESQWNIGQFHFSQKNDAPVKSADSIESIGEAVHPADGILAVSGASGFHENQKVPNVLVEQNKSSSTSEIQSVASGNKPEIFSCKVCGKCIDEHTKRNSLGNPTYFCCVCKYETDKASYLQIHIRIHCPKDDCSVCSKEHTDGILHDGKQMCQLCHVTFNCRTELGEHLLEHHRPHFEIHCWGCSLSIYDHYTVRKGETLHFCCICGYNTRRRNDIVSHNDKHRPKRFCRICREEYPDEQKGLHNRKYSCIKCGKEFKCRTQLEDHYKGYISCAQHFSEHCRLCNEIISKHGVEREEHKLYKCCACPEELGEKYKFWIHLYVHLDLGIFKCGNCGKRLQHQSSLKKHSKKCIPSPFPCEICRARFPSRDSLNEHCLEKHRQT